MKKSSLKLISLLSIMAFQAFANTGEEQWYQVEVLIFETKDKEALAEQWPLEPGRPSLANSIALTADPQASFGQLPETQYILKEVKSRLQKSYPIVFHTARRQALTEKGTAKKIHLIGGKAYNPLKETQQLNGQHEVEGIIRFSGGRNFQVDADLLLKKPMKIVAKGEENLNTAQFKPLSMQAWQEDPQGRLQAFRIKGSSRLLPNEIQYLDHPMYGMIVVINPQASSQAIEGKTTS